jgi:hypothetical protein
MIDLMEWIYFSSRNGKPEDLQLKSNAMREFTQTSSEGTIDFVFKIQKWDLEF